MNKLEVSIAMMCALAASAAVTNAEAPVGRYVITASTVLDQRTGLTWQRTAATTKHAQPSAISYCVAPTPALPGVGWRLPSIAELQSLIDDTRARPAIDSKAFPNTPSDGFWTASVSIGGSAGFAWYVDFATGTPWTVQATEALSVRCVR